MPDGKRFVIGWAIAFAIGAFYPVSVAYTLNWHMELVGRWLVNDIMYTLYVVAVSPFLVGSLASILHLKHLKSVTKGIRYPLCAGLFLFAFLTSWQGAESVLEGMPRSVVPVMLSSDKAVEAYRLDMCIRDKLDLTRLEKTGQNEAGESERELSAARITNLRSTVHTGCLDPKGKPSPEETAYRNENECDESDSKAAVCEYLWHIDRKQGRRPGDCRSSLGCIATVVLTVYASVIMSLLFWYYVVLTISRTVRPTERNGAILCYVLVVLWFPFRLYGDWYYNFYNTSFTETSGRIIFLAFIVAIILVWLILLLKIPKIGALLFGLTTFIPLAIGVGATINPGLFTGVSRIIGGFGMADYLVAIFVVIVTFWMISYQFVVGAAPDDAEEP